ncbi:hypothetical protein [Actinoallomurus acaciae]|uniref:Uncharacterized protein n=1 Tax=Actinoallomurus acaciae TaxID=502577 RepID=A0ABV5YYE0_9ACTN
MRPAARALASAAVVAVMALLAFLPIAHGVHDLGVTPDLDHVTCGYATGADEMSPSDRCVTDHGTFTYEEMAEHHARGVHQHGWFFIVLGSLLGLAGSAFIPAFVVNTGRLLRRGRTARP